MSLQKLFQITLHDTEIKSCPNRKKKEIKNVKKKKSFPEREKKLTGNLHKRIPERIIRNTSCSDKSQNTLHVVSGYQSESFG